MGRIILRVLVFLLPAAIISLQILRGTERSRRNSRKISLIGWAVLILAVISIPTNYFATKIAKEESDASFRLYKDSVTASVTRTVTARLQSENEIVIQKMLTNLHANTNTVLSNLSSASKEYLTQLKARTSAVNDSILTYYSATRNLISDQTKATLDSFNRGVAESVTQLRENLDTASFYSLPIQGFTISIWINGLSNAADSLWRLANGDYIELPPPSTPMTSVSQSTIQTALLREVLFPGLHDSDLAGDTSFTFWIITISNAPILQLSIGLKHDKNGWTPFANVNDMNLEVRLPFYRPRDNSNPWITVLPQGNSYQFLLTLTAKDLASMKFAPLGLNGASLRNRNNVAVVSLDGLRRDFSVRHFIRNFNSRQKGTMLISIHPLNAERFDLEQNFPMTLDDSLLSDLGPVYTRSGISTGSQVAFRVLRSFVRIIIR